MKIKELENGFYLFMLDHSQFFNNEFYRAVVNFKNKEDLIRRIYSRATGLFVMKDKEEIDRLLKKQHDTYKLALKYMRAREESDRKLQIMSKGTKTQKLLRHVVLFNRKLEKYITK